jgi:ATP-binding cassette subfamily F protein 3
MRIEHITLSFGTHEVFRDVTCHIAEDEKVGIVGVNGAGKTTLFKIILGMIEPDDGKIFLPKGSRVGLLPQEIDPSVLRSKTVVFDYLLEGRPIAQLNHELQSLYDLISTTSSKNDLHIQFGKVEAIQERLEYWDEFNAENILMRIITGMGITDRQLFEPLSNLSGGQKSKIAFARLLYSNPEVMLLDEPTNHLDASSKDFVIDFLKNYDGSVLVISHDTPFLDSVTGKTLFVDKLNKSMQMYDGSYSRFQKTRAEQEKALQHKYNIQQREEEKLKLIINKYASVSGKRKRMAQDREKKLERLQKNRVELASHQKDLVFDIEQKRESSDIPIRIRNLSFKYDRASCKNVIDSLSFDLMRGERFLVLGRNGAGKSTLLKLIIGQLQPDKGEVKVGSKTDIGYYAQEHELLVGEATILSNLAGFNMSEAKLRSALSKFLFYGEEVHKTVCSLSPGERSRVALLKLALTGANVLLLDEPTNHLDVETQHAIAKTFSSYKGAMLVVSHNPDFVDNLGIERVLLLPDGLITYYDRNKVEQFQATNSE